MSNYVVSRSTNDLSSIAKQIVLDSPSNKIMAFVGELGAGKTTLIGNICHYLGVIEYLGSPTFSLVNEYELKNSSGIYHFDCFRIQSDEEMLDIGWDEYLQQKKWILIEWPEKIENLLPDHFLLVNIKVDGNNRRIDWKML
jgi:tRNA threonylcarbamoyladenosine biosynthesis protein TsaE